MTHMTDSNNGVSLMQSGQYDGISASGDATTRLIQGGIVAPIDTSILENYANVFAGPKDLPHNTVDGVNYGVPQRGANLLMYNTEEVTPAPTTWDSVWEGRLRLQGQDQHLRLVDLHRRRGAAPDDHQPGPGITNPYQLNEAQFDAAIALLEAQRATAPCTGRCTPTRWRPTPPATSSPARPGRSRLRCSRSEASRSRASCPTRVPPAGRTPG